MYLYDVVFRRALAVSVEAVVLFGVGGLLYMIYDVVLAYVKLFLWRQWCSLAAWC